MEIILIHYPNKPQYTPHVNSLLDQRYTFACFCNLYKFHSSCSALQVQFSIYKSSKRKIHAPNHLSMVLIAYSFLTPYISIY